MRRLHLPLMHQLNRKALQLSVLVSVLYSGWLVGRGRGISRTCLVLRMKYQLVVRSTPYKRNWGGHGAVSPVVFQPQVHPCFHARMQHDGMRYAHSLARPLCLYNTGTAISLRSTPPHRPAQTFWLQQLKQLEGSASSPTCETLWCQAWKHEHRVIFYSSAIRERGIRLQAHAATSSSAPPPRPAASRQ